jgi:hypothetical protein
MAASSALSPGLLGASLTILVGIAIPLALYYSEPGETRPRLRLWFVWPAAVLAAAVMAYLLAGIEYQLTTHANVWGVFITSLVLLELLAVVVVVQADRAMARRPTSADSSVAGATVAERADPSVPAPQVTESQSPPRVEVCTSSSQFAETILAIERSSTSVDRMTKRISAVFKDPSAVEAIAAGRFGPGSRQAEAYRWEHRERHRIFVENLTGRGGVCREIYQVRELRGYFGERYHGVDVVLDRDVLIKTARDWLRAMADFDSYYVGITSDPIPLKYQIFDQRTVVIHEAAGRMDGQRLNALVVRDEISVRAFQSDFDYVWESIPIEMRTRKTVIQYVESELLALLKSE